MSQLRLLLFVCNRQLTGNMLYDCHNSCLQVTVQNSRVIYQKLRVFLYVKKLSTLKEPEGSKCVHASFLLVISEISLIQSTTIFL
jgi:hypothetical protein